MFRDKNQKSSKSEAGKSQNRIGHGTQLEGDIVSEGGFRIDGVLTGSLKTSGKVVIGQEGAIIGTLECSNADIQGKFKGTMNVTELLSLKSTAVIDGDVVTAKLMVEPGTEFNGTCTMNKGVKSLNQKSDKNSKSDRTA
jgi:cytoskeletal protein CcmA (bactofilin family)